MSIRGREHHPHGDKQQPEESGQGPRGDRQTTMTKYANVRLGPGRQANKTPSGGSREVTGLGLLRKEEGLEQSSGRETTCCEGVAVPEADGNRVGPLGAY